MYKKILFIILIINLYEFIIVQNCRFAQKYTTIELLNSEEKRKKFFNEISFHEGKFHQNGVGVNLKSGMTYDGHKLEIKTGSLLKDGLHFWSASSKEALHLKMLAKALDNDKNAQIFFHSSLCKENDFDVCMKTFDRSKVLSSVFDILHRKMNSYVNFLIK
jgi:hypothetical protein